MTLEDRDIICCSTHYWDERRFRKQEFMARFARSNRVLYVEPSFSMVRQPERHLRGIADNRFGVPFTEDREPGLRLLKPPRGLPRWGHPMIERITYRWYGHIINHAAAAWGLRDPILWIYRPSFRHALDVISHSALVVDLVDDLSAYGGTHLEHVERDIQDLASSSDLLVVTARTLLERYGPLARRSIEVPNGFDARRFEPNDAPPPPELSRLRRPILGFVGTLFPFLDFGLLESVAKLNPDKSLVLLGPVESQSQSDVDRLATLANVMHLGPRAQADIPRYLRAFDVCLNPFRGGRVADSVSPLKVYEYLAAGRPVVSTPMRSLMAEPAGGSVRFAKDPESFSREIAMCLTEQVQRESDGRRQAVADHTWDRLFKRLDASVSDALED